jgi:ANTAR domain-containing protein
MDADHRMRLWGLVVRCARGAPVELGHVCDAAISAANVDSAALSVTGSATPRETLYVSDPFASVLEELVLTLGEGPGVDALAGGVVQAADITDAASVARWPVFAPAAGQAGARAVFGLPLQAGGIRLGVMDLYRSQPGGLDGQQLADALILADTACALLLDLAGQAPAEQGLGREYQDGPEPVGGQHPVVHQATGMLIVQLGVSAAAAMIRLRAYAYAHDRRLRDVAADVVARRLRFDSEG